MKKLILLCLLLIALCKSSFSQSTNLQETNNQIKRTAIGFLKWYKANRNYLEKNKIVTGFNPDTIKRDSIIKINTYAVEKYLSNFRKSTYVSEIFLNNLRAVYKNVSDSLLKNPIIDYFGPIPGLESDLLFGFEPEQVLDHIKQGKFTKIYVVYDKAVAKFDISKFNQCVFTMTKIKGKWLIDYFGYDGTNRDKYLK